MVGLTRLVAKWVVVTLAVALLLTGCGPRDGEPVRLLTGDWPCYTSEVHGLLVADATYGTAIIDDTAPIEAGPSPSRLPVAWRQGFTAQRVGSEVEVRDARGFLANTTGQRVTLPGGYGGVGGVTAWLNCNLGHP